MRGLMCCLSCYTTDQNFGRERSTLDTVAKVAVVAGHIIQKTASGASPAMKDGNSRRSVKPFVFSPDRTHRVTDDANVGLATAVGSSMGGVAL